MKKFTIFLFMVVILAGNMHADSPCDGIPNIYNEINAAVFYKDKTKALNVIKQIQSVDDWSFGAGLGPTDKTSLTITALIALYPILSSDSDASNNTALLESLGINQNNWGDLNSESYLVEMMSSNNVASRWLALQQLSNSSDVSPMIINKLIDISTEDEYLRISLRHTTNDDTSQPIAWQMPPI